jgi:AraC-like DNA-binding protein
MRQSSEVSHYTVFSHLGVEFLQAHFRTHRYARHSHDSYAIGLTLEGVQSFRCRGEQRHGLPGSILAINPDEMHDGHSGTAAGYRYCMFYVTPRAMMAALEDVRERPVAAPVFVSPLVSDIAIARSAARFRDALSRSVDSLEQETALHELLWSLFARHVEAAPRSGVSRAAPAERLQRVRDFLHANLHASLSLRDLSAIAGMSRFSLNSGFRRAFGLPPHAYLTRLRLAAARALIEAGEPLAQVAPEVGFVDQSHLTRQFKAWFGVTPGAFQPGTRTTIQSPSAESRQTPTG